MNVVEQILFRLRMDGQRAVNAGFAETARSADRVGDATRRAERANRGAARSFAAVRVGARGASGSVGVMARGLGGLVATAGGLYLVKATFDRTVDSASDLGEEVNKTRVVFRGAEREMLRWSKGSARGFGQSRRQALEASSTIGNMLVPMGMARRRAAEMSRELVVLAGDLASFNNADPSEVLEALRSGLAGESEPLRRFGVFINEARLRQVAMSKGLVDGRKPLTDQARALATYALILRDTKDAQGDFARTSGGLANQRRILRASFENVGSSLGRYLLPTARDATSIAADFSSNVERALNRRDLDFGEKARFLWRATKRDLDPAIDDIQRWLEREDVKQRVVDGIETWTPRVIDATAESMAKAGPRAAGAFITGFTHLGPWGRLLTVAFLMKKMGAFGPAGRLSAGLFARTWAGAAMRSSVWGSTGRQVGAQVGKQAAALSAITTATQLPVSMEARRGRFARAGRIAGRGFGAAFGVGAAVAIGLALSEAAKDLFPGLERYSGAKGWANLSNDISDGAEGIFGKSDFEKKIDDYRDAGLIGDPALRPNADDIARARRPQPSRDPFAPELVPGSGSRFPRARGSSVAPRARGTRRDIHIHNHQHLDGREVARNTLRHVDDDDSWGRD